MYPYVHVVVYKEGFENKQTKYYKPGVEQQIHKQTLDSAGCMRLSGRGSDARAENVLVDESQQIVNVDNKKKKTKRK